MVVPSSNRIRLITSSTTTTTTTTTAAAATTTAAAATTTATPATTTTTTATTAGTTTILLYYTAGTASRTSCTRNSSTRLDSTIMYRCVHTNTTASHTTTTPPQIWAALPFWGRECCWSHVFTLHIYVTFEYFWQNQLVFCWGWTRCGRQDSCFTHSCASGSGTVLYGCGGKQVWALASRSSLYSCDGAPNVFLEYGFSFVLCSSIHFHLRAYLAFCATTQEWCGNKSCGSQADEGTAVLPLPAGRDMFRSGASWTTGTGHVRGERLAVRRKLSRFPMKSWSSVMLWFEFDSSWAEVGALEAVEV